MKTSKDVAHSSDASTEPRSPNMLLLAGGGAVALVAAGALAFVLLGGGGADADEGSLIVAPRPTSTAPTADGTSVPTTSASIPTYAAANAKDPFKALVSDAGGGGGAAGGQPTTAPGPGAGSGGGGVVTVPGRVVTVTTTVAPTSAPTSVPVPTTSGPTSTATQTPAPSTSTTTIQLPSGTQLVYLGDIVKGEDGKPQSVTVYVDNAPYKGLTPQRDVEPAKQVSFAKYYKLVSLSETCATVQYGDGSLFDVCQGQYHYVRS